MSATGSSRAATQPTANKGRLSMMRCACEGVAADLLQKHNPRISKMLRIESDQIVEQVPQTKFSSMRSSLLLTIIAQARATKSSMLWLAALRVSSSQAQALVRSSAGNSILWKYRAETRLIATSTWVNIKYAKMLACNLQSFHQRVIS